MFRIINRGYLLWLLAALFLNFEMALQSAPSVMVDPLLHDLHLNPSQLGWLAGSFFITYAGMQIPAGMLMDRFRHWWPLWIATVLCTLGSFLFANSHSLWQAMTARACMGIGGAFAFLGTLLMARRYLSPSHYALMVGLTQLIAALGPMIAQIALSWLLVHFPWQDVFFATGAAGIALLVCMLLAKPWVPWEGELTSALTAQPQTIYQSFIGIMRTPSTHWLALYAFCLWAPMVVVADLWGPKYLMLVLHWSTTKAASYTSLIWFFLAVSSLFLGWFISTGKSVLAVMQYCAFGMLVATLILIYFSAAWTMVVALALLGIVVAGQAMSFVLVAKLQGQANQGIAAGVNNMAVVLSGAILQPLTATTVDRFSQQHVLTVYSIKMGMAWLIVMALAALWAGYRLKSLTK